MTNPRGSASRASITRRSSVRRGHVRNFCAMCARATLRCGLRFSRCWINRYLLKSFFESGARRAYDDAPTVRVGQRLGSYEVQALVGRGGMGEVYRARDTRLARDVAIKILPRLFTNDPDRLARFEREARVLASLNHPHVGAIYGLEDADGVRALVLELVDGETLADRIARGPVPLNETLSIARQVADALEAAHEKGIIHRELKPANIRLTADSVVKVLDFGPAAPGDRRRAP